MSNRVLAGAAAFAFLSTSAVAQTALDPDAVVSDVRKVLAANYVLPETRPKLDAVLAKGLAEGRYKVTDPTLLADRLNEDMSSVAHDKHLSISF
ncbi:MAG TPA: hypothetical protein VGE68_04280, partial [Sphingomicrobium sp.]